MRAIAPETKSHRIPCKLSGRLLVCWEVQTALRQRTLVHGGGRESECENARQSGGGNHTATQLSEQRSRRTGNSENWRRTENFPVRHAESLHNASNAKLGNLAMDGQIFWILCHEVRTRSGWHHTVQGSV